MRKKINVTRGCIEKCCTIRRRNKENFYSYGNLSDKNNQYNLIDLLYRKFPKIIFQVTLKGKLLFVYTNIGKETDKWRKFRDFCISIDGDFVNFNVREDGVPAIEWEFD